MPQLVKHVLDFFLSFKGMGHMPPCGAFIGFFKFYIRLPLLGVMGTRKHNTQNKLAITQ